MVFTENVSIVSMVHCRTALCVLQLKSNLWWSCDQLITDSYSWYYQLDKYIEVLPKKPDKRTLTSIARRVLLSEFGCQPQLYKRPLERTSSSVGLLPSRQYPVGSRLNNCNRAKRGHKASGFHKRVFCQVSKPHSGQPLRLRWSLTIVKFNKTFMLKVAPDQELIMFLSHLFWSVAMKPQTIENSYKSQSLQTRQQTPQNSQFFSLSGLSRAADQV